MAYIRYGGRRGLALVAVLWVVMLLTVIVTVLGKTVRLDSYISQSAAQQVQGKWALRSGVEKAFALLNEDGKQSDSLTDIWSENDVDCNDIDLGECALSIKITDEAGKLNLNTATKKQLMQLLYMTDEIAESIIDWRDKDDQPQQEGAESGYYLNLTYGYNIRNGPFRTIRELLLVKGVTEDLFYGEDTNFNGKLDRNECDGSLTPPLDNEDDLLDKGWIEYLTCYSFDKNEDARGAERVNINEADEKKLTKSLNIKKAHAKWIVENRANKYSSIADLINQDRKRSSSKQEKDSDQAEPLDLETFISIADKISITNDKRIPGRVNINTASREIWEILLEGNEELAENIIVYREGLTTGMESIADLLKVKGMSVETFKKIANDITTRSDIYRIRCKAESMIINAKYLSTTIVDRGAGSGVVLYRYQGADN